MLWTRWCFSLHSNNSDVQVSTDFSSFPGEKSSKAKQNSLHNVSTLCKEGGVEIEGVGGRARDRLVDIRHVKDSRVYLLYKLLIHVQRKSRFTLIAVRMTSRCPDEGSYHAADFGER